MTPVTSISALSVGRVSDPSRPPQEGHVAQLRGAADSRQASRLEKQLESSGADEATVANLRANIEELFTDHAESGEHSDALHEKVESMFQEHGFNFDRLSGNNSVIAYGKIVTQNQLGQIQLTDPPAQGSLRQLLRAVEESRSPDAPVTTTETTLQAMFGIDITV